MTLSEPDGDGLRGALTDLLLVAEDAIGKALLPGQAPPA